MRWKLFIPFVVIVFLVIIINAFFLGVIIEKTIEKAGAKIVGAKVEVKKVHADIFKLSFRIKGLKVADPKDEWRNIFESDSINFSLQPWPLLRKKFIIEEMSFSGLEWSTKRTKSGKLPVKKKKHKAGQENNELNEGSAGTIKPKTTSIGSLAGKIDVAQFIDPDKLRSVRRVKEIKNDIEDKNAKWENKLAASSTMSEIDSLKKQILGVSVTGNMGWEEAKAALSEINKAKTELEKIKTGVETEKNIFESDIRTISGYIGEIDNIRKQDIKSIIGELTGGIKTEDIARSVFGSVWINKINTALSWIDKARVYMPKSTKLKPAKRKEGIIVKFPEKYKLPAFLIKRIFVSGRTPQQMDFSGEISGITSDPSVYGKPAIIDIKAWFPNIDIEKTFVQFKAVLDHTKKESLDEFSVRGRNIPINEFRIGESDFLPNILKVGSADVETVISLREKEIDSKLDLNFNKLSFVSDDNNVTKNEFADLVREMLRDLGTVKVKGRVYGQIDNIRFEMRSNLDALLSAKFNEIAARRFREEEKKIKAEVDRIIDEAKSDVNVQLENVNSKFGSVINSQKDTVEEQLRAAGSKIDKLRSQTESQLQQEKKKEEEKLKKEIGQGIKNLFGQ